MTLALLTLAGLAKVCSALRVGTLPALPPYQQARAELTVSGDGQGQDYYGRVGKTAVGLGWRSRGGR